jgi:hypothetical protein
MSPHRAGNGHTKPQFDPELAATQRDRNVVKTAKMILADFTEASKSTAYALLKIAAQRRK